MKPDEIKMINTVAPTIRMLLAKDGQYPFVRFEQTEQDSDCLSITILKEFSQDQIIDTVSEAISKAEYPVNKIHVKGLGGFSAKYFNSDTPGRVAGKIAIITGAAQGFGLEIAHNLASQGAITALADINEETVNKAAEGICKKFKNHTAIPLVMDVTDQDSVRLAVDKVIRTFGGLDLLISNAGVLKAQSVKTQPITDFDLVAAVNYKGYFICTQAVAPILALQHKVEPNYTSDIIQINSKSGLAGSNRNAAYAGSKFGGIGLTQSFALELVEDGIKVNSICPGNFFDGPLWSDPENGLFVQYLRSGKVAGAKSIHDIRKAYEQKIPMRRGCTTADVMPAIYYLIEQRYETGQAIPVTGGQIMRH